jgi:hypothetical protein
MGASPLRLQWESVGPFSVRCNGALSVQEPDQFPFERFKVGVFLLEHFPTIDPRGRGAVPEGREVEIVPAVAQTLKNQFRRPARNWMAGVPVARKTFSRQLIELPFCILQRGRLDGRKPAVPVASDCHFDPAILAGQAEIQTGNKERAKNRHQLEREKKGRVPRYLAKKRYDMEQATSMTPPRSSASLPA